MRITNGMITANALRSISAAANRLAAANETASSQKKIQLASDDPTVAGRAVTYRSYVAQIKQYQDNVEAADGWQTATNDALSNLSDVVQQVRELATKASNDTCSDEDKTSIATQIETLRTQAISLMNTTYDGRYVFGGYNTTTAPYKLVSTSIGDAVTYKGDYLGMGGAVSSSIDDATIESFCQSNTAYSSGATTQDINYKTGFGSEVTVNVEGQSVTGENAGSDLFSTFSKLLLSLNGDTSYKTASSTTSGGTTTVTVSSETLDTSSLLDELDTDYSRITTSQAVLGARMDMVDNATDVLGDAYTAYKTLQSNNEDADTAESSTEQTSAEYTYEASLSVGAKAIAKTLIDYIG